jgi:hypothetical protein
MPWQKLLKRLDAAKTSLLSLGTTGMDLEELRWARQIPQLIPRWKETNPRIVQILLSFWETEKWPTLTQEEFIFVRWRVEWAYRVVELLDCAEKSLALSASSLEEKALFEYILRQVWDAYGADDTVVLLSALFRGYLAGTEYNKPNRQDRG